MSNNSPLHIAELIRIYKLTDLEIFNTYWLVNWQERVK